MATDNKKGYKALKKSGKGTKEYEYIIPEIDQAVKGFIESLKLKPDEVLNIKLVVSADGKDSLTLTSKLHDI